MDPALSLAGLVRSWRITMLSDSDLSVSYSRYSLKCIVLQKSILEIVNYQIHCSLFGKWRRALSSRPLEKSVSEAERIT